jgi:isopentenyl diphosphate isomerase/L-lactate dehydrogenase-like FMN-dependent dehydrogenase
MRPDQEIVRRELGERLFAYLMGRPADMRPDEADPNEAALARYKLVPRVMAARQGIDITLDFCGRRIAAPLGVGAYAADRLFHPDGVLPVAEVCAELGLPLMISEECLTPIQTITALHSDCWLQIRGAGPLQRAQTLIEAAFEAGVRGILVSLLAPTHLRPGLYPGGVDIGQEIMDRGFRTIAERAGSHPVEPFPTWGWTDLKALAAHAASMGLPVIAKGVLDPDDAVRAFAVGCDGVMVSNMGVRNVGRWVPAVSQLPAIRAACSKPSQILLLDGGIRVPPDVVVARVLGAGLTTIVRPVVLALVEGGIAAVRVLLTGFINAITSIVSWMGADKLEDLKPGKAVIVG